MTNSIVKRAIPAIVFAALMCGSAPAALAADIPTVKSVLGHDVGEDYFLADYGQSLDYFHRLAASSDRIRMVSAGKTTQGRPMEYAIISSPANLAKFDHYKDISRRLAAVKGLDDAAAKALAKEGKVIVHIDGGMHSSEVSTHQSMIALAYKLVATQNDEQIDRILDKVVVIVWPTLNPDGMDMVVDWYRKNRGTPWETSRTPWLYQEYVGHDNNRDGYMLNMIEARTIYKAEQDYSPEVWYSHHQVAPGPARIWVPPFADPISSNISPYMRTWTTLIGTGMMAAFEEKQMPGAVAEARFDNWYPGFLDYTHVFRNTMSFFTEVAHDSATPKFYDLKDFPKDKKDLKSLVMYPSPWKGGWWHFADSLRYEDVASMSLLDTASRYGEVMLYNRYQAGRDTMRHFATEGPFAWVIPGGQADAPEAALLAQKMIDQGVEVRKATAPVTLGDRTYPAGSWVILMDQPFAQLVQELFERQKYPDAILDGGGKPVDLPYDVTGWTLPMQMGVATSAVLQKIPDDVRAALAPVAKADVPGSFSGSGSSFVLSRRTNASFLAVNDAVKKGARLGFSTGPVDTALGSETGAIVLGGISPAAMSAIATANGAAVVATTAAPATEVAKRARVGLYRPWGSNIDEGWTRWLLEKYQFGPTTLRNTDMQKGNLRARYDTIILPDLGPNNPFASLRNGLKPEEAPPPYSGGIGDEGVIALRKFVADGGTLVALNTASDAVIDMLALPVTNLVKTLGSDAFFCSGALLQIKLDPTSRVAAGMPVDPVVMFERGPVFAPAPGFKGRILATYPADASPLRSGVILHPERIQGKAAAVEVEYGKGHIYLYGFKPQWRGQAHGTYKLLFNTLYAYAQPDVAPPVAVPVPPFKGMH